MCKNIVHSTTTRSTVVGVLREVVAGEHRRANTRVLLTTPIQCEDLCLSTSRMAFTEIKSNLCRENVVIPFLRVTKLRATIKGADLT